jgi:hypothetical protein
MNILKQCIFVGLFSFFLALKAVGQVTVNVSDDLNNLISVLSEYPQAETPIIETLAKRGIVFTNVRSADTCRPREVHEGTRAVIEYLRRRRNGT